MSFLQSLLANTWSLTAEMAPYLLVGFIAAGLLHWLVHPGWIRRWLGRPGLAGIRNGCLVGVPMPLCSCSVIPVATSLHRSGASRGATVSFLSSTPQTGVDSILATYSLMGGLFTLVRVIVAFFSGLVAGLLVERLAEKPTGQSPADSCGANNSCCGAAREPEPASTASCCSGETGHRKSVVDALRYAILTLPADLAGALLVGLAMAGCIATLLPAGWLEGTALSSGFAAFGIATLVSLPLYVCATASIPMAYALVAGGFSPGAALVFLIVGPATNTATVAALWKLLGRNAAIVYVASLVLVAWLAGWLFNALPGPAALELHHHPDESGQIAPWQQVTALFLIAVLAFSRLARSRTPSID